MKLHNTPGSPVGPRGGTPPVVFSLGGNTTGEDALMLVAGLVGA